jgi:hypothetical protein
MLVTQLGPNDCRLYPTADKDGFGFLAELSVVILLSDKLKRYNSTNNKRWGCPLFISFIFV